LLLGICFRARRTVDGQNGDRCRGVRGSGDAVAEEEDFAKRGLRRGLHRCAGKDEADEDVAVEIHGAEPTVFAAPP